ncbi:cyclopropane-fatty-acyl-phospholipid synthase [Rhodopseudomonas julia]|uniref:Cyclopropane-fatty-acyl-phospholipid synthase n=1 Tax=Rhodopseudomonas julia TaxID=200617 RepID=A0ABU0C9H3_9BRAD|nr:cyclopropane-fatty-acyl-phospholipid synthase family protein [Rhodopseudomonas julia]MDQ0327183.1 cyclopropane-fatty-acyl-phospholipid synthase [Rhodopseudomonas julia]
MWLLKSILRQFVRNGRLTLIDAEGREHLFGGKKPGPVVTMRLHDPKLHWQLAMNPELVAPEAYMDGTLTFENGATVHEFLRLFSINQDYLSAHPAQTVVNTGYRALRRWHQNNMPGRSKQNAKHHYNVKEDVYRLFLDERMQYSCAYWRDPENETLEDAQLAKLRHIGAKLQLRPGMKVLDIGSGWGGLAIFLAETFDVEVMGVNPATEQLAAARRWAEAKGLSGRVKFVEKDYREIEGEFDRIVSVGMFEHVGYRFYDAYFRKVFSLLKPDGFMVLHSIGRMSPPGITGPFLNKYIFPGGYVPAISEVFAATERNRLWVCDAEVLRLHYGYTIREWYNRFQANRDKAIELMDERFVRMWEFYLAAVELGFVHGSNMVFQLILARQRDAVPIVRDWIEETEKQLRQGSLLVDAAQ